MTTSRRGERTSAAIAAAAERLFASQGVGPTTIDDIASAAGVSVGSVYVHYGSKEDLHAALVQRAVEERGQRLSVRYWSESPLQRLVHTGDAYADFAVQRPSSFWLSAREAELSAIAPPEGEPGSYDLSAAAQSLRGDVEAAAAAGEIRTAPADEILNYLWGAWTGLIAVHLVNEPGVEVRRTLHFAFQMVADGLLPRARTREVV